MSWLLTASGVPFSIGRANAVDVNLTDVAHHLALINRFCGATTRPYSVAEHSLLVAEICERDFGMTDPSGLLAALMHDAHEAYFGDISTPVKHHLGEEARVLEWSLERAVQDRYGLRTPNVGYRDLIRRADLMALATERRDLMNPNPTPWAVLQGIDPVSWIDLRQRDGMDWTDWREAFKARFGELNLARAVRAGANPVEVIEGFAA